MVRVSTAVPSRKRRKRVLKKAKGFYGDRKNHYRQSVNTVMRAMAFNYIHRKKKKSDFRQLWNIRINTAARQNGMSYSRLIDGLTKAGCVVDRKMLADLAINDAEAFTAVVATAQKALG